MRWVPGDAFRGFTKYFLSSCSEIRITKESQQFVIVLVNRFASSDRKLKKDLNSEGEC